MRAVTLVFCSLHQDPFNGLLNPDDYEKGPGAMQSGTTVYTSQLTEAWRKPGSVPSLRAAWGPLVPPAPRFLQGTVTVKDKLAKLGKQNNPHWAWSLIETFGALLGELAISPTVRLGL